MQKVYSSPNLTMIYHFKNILETHGIESMVTGEHLTFAAGGVAPIDAWIDLWILMKINWKKPKRFWRHWLKVKKINKSNV
jgi:hypothetical protein